jgi:hypothetical protein
MPTIQIRKKSAKVWIHVPDDALVSIITKFYAKTNGDNFRIIEENDSDRKEYLYSDITVYDDTDGSLPETFANPIDLMLRLEVLKYVGFNRDGDVPPLGSQLALFQNFAATDGQTVFTINAGFGVVSMHVNNAFIQPINRWNQVTTTLTYTGSEPLVLGDEISFALIKL